ncbi:hypothetical protein PoB_001546600, partial [Plakobranchus ocellatus]
TYRNWCSNLHGDPCHPRLLLKTKMNGDEDVADNDDDEDVDDDVDDDYDGDDDDDDGEEEEKRRRL